MTITKKDLYMKTACFTGHRPNKLGGYNKNNPTATFVRNQLYRAIEYLIDQGITTFISGMALGVDTWAAEIVLELREQNPNIKLVCAIPFKGQESRWYQKSKQIYQSILDKADSVVTVSPGGYSAHKMQVRNEYMVNNSDFVIAVWDGTKGGTFNCIKYANSAEHNPTIIRIEP